MANNDWTQKEVELIVADYFEMLQSELEDKDYNKTAHRTALLQVIKRSEASIEFKHRNISAVLINMGLPYIRGYKPLFNYQKQLLEIQVSNYLNNSQATFEKDFENFNEKLSEISFRKSSVISD